MVMQDLMDRVVILIDMDCFYVQVEQKFSPEYQNKPCAVVQYKNFKGGGIIAVNYEARHFGIKRGGMHGDDAKQLCPEIHLFQVPELRGKADLTRYRDASAQIFEVLKRFSAVVERASVDEAYLDVTQEIDNWLSECGDSVNLSHADLPNTFIEGMSSSADDTGLVSWLKTSFTWDKTAKRLALAARLCERIRLSVLDETGFKCSAGIAPNKMLAKLACGLHKPNKQTVILPSCVTQLLKSVPIFKIRNFGGHLGAEISSRFQVDTMGDLLDIPRERLIAEFGEKNGSRIYNVARGVDGEAVVSRQIVKSIGCGKNFRGSEQLVSRSKIKFWLNQMSDELEERLNRDRNANDRIAELLTVGALLVDKDGQVQHHSRCVKLDSYIAKTMANNGYKALSKLGKPIDENNTDAWNPPIANLSLTASKFSNRPSHTSSIRTFFQNGANKGGSFSLPKSPTKKGLRSPYLSAASTQKCLLPRKSLKSGKTSSEQHDQSSRITDDCEISWADESAWRDPLKHDELQNGHDMSSDVSEEDEDEGGSDGPNSHPTASINEAVATLKQKNFERVSASIRSIIRNTLQNGTLELEEQQAPMEKEGGISNVDNKSGSKSSFFKRKALERKTEAVSVVSKSFLANDNVIIIDEGDGASSSNKKEPSLVIDLETPCSSRVADLAIEAASHGPKQQYYCTVDAASVDLDVLKQMPLEIQREYEFALGLNVNETKETASNKPAFLTIGQNRKRQLVDNKALAKRNKKMSAASNSGAKPKGKGNNRPESSSSISKFPAITIDDFFR